jgi:hypothetical protein
LNCGHEWPSETCKPRCKSCDSSKVLNTKDAPEKYDILKLRADTNRRLNEFAEEFHTVNIKFQELSNGYTYLKGKSDTLTKENEDLKERINRLELRRE